MGYLGLAGHMHGRWLSYLCMLIVHARYHVLKTYLNQLDGYYLDGYYGCRVIGQVNLVSFDEIRDVL